MNLPKFDAYIGPILGLLASGEEFTLESIRQAMITDFGFTKEQAEEKLGSGKQSVVDNRIGWAITYAVKARLIERTGYARVRITPRGRQLREERGNLIGVKELASFPEFKEFQSKTSPRRVAATSAPVGSTKPETTISAPRPAPAVTEEQQISFMAGKHKLTMSVADMAKLVRELQSN